MAEVAPQLVIEIEANTLDEARRQLGSQTPSGFYPFSEQVVSDGGEVRSVKADADTEDEAFAKAQSNLPTNAVFIRRNVRIPSERRSDWNRSVLASNEAQARNSALDYARFEDDSASYRGRPQYWTEIIAGAVTLREPERKGLLGFGKRRAIYEVEVLRSRHAHVEITYQTKARIRVTLDSDRSAIMQELRCSGAQYGDFRINSLISSLVAEHSIRGVSEESLGWLIEHAEHHKGGGFITLLLEANCRSTTAWNSLIQVSPLYVTADVAVRALVGALWYLDTPEASCAIDTRQKGQRWCLELAASHFTLLDLPLRKQVMAMLKDMMRAGNDMVSVCKSLVEMVRTGGADVMKSVAGGIRLCNIGNGEMASLCQFIKFQYSNVALILEFFDLPLQTQVMAMLAKGIAAENIGDGSNMASLCELMFKTGRADVLESVAKGIRLCNVAYTERRSRDTDCDCTNARQHSELRSWEQFKRAVENALGREK